MSKNNEYEFTLRPRVINGMMRHWSLDTRLPWEEGKADRRSFEVRIEFHYGLDGPDYSRFELFEHTEGEGELEIVETKEEWKELVTSLMANEEVTEGEAVERLSKKYRPAYVWEVPATEILRQAHRRWEALRLIVNPCITY